MQFLRHVSALVLLSFRRVTLGQQVAAPLVFQPTGEWLGNDGPWSVFSLQVGTPAQEVKVLPGSSASSVFAIIAQGCEGAAGKSNNCSNLRGGIYAGNQSATFEQIGVYQTGQDAQLGLAVNAVYGTDTVSLGDQSSGLPSLAHTAIAQIASADIWLGLFGISPETTNFTSDPYDLGTPFFAALRSDAWIASQTWAYTAGSVNRNVTGSLIFGGFDASLFDPTRSVEASLDEYPGRDLSIDIQDIKSEGASLLPGGGITAFIDSTAPQIWLPQSACDAFATAFNLTYNASSNYYTVSDSTHAALSQRNASVDFILQGSGATNTISLSYDSFDLVLGWPLADGFADTNATQHYFPLRQAQNSSQYTLGRAFLQEVYVIADYDRKTFNVSQAVFDSEESRVFTITPPSNSTNSTSSPTTSGSGGSTSPTPRPHSSGLTGGDWAGIAIGIVAAIALAYLGFAWITKRRPFRRNFSPTSFNSDDFHSKAELAGESKSFAEAPPSSEVKEMYGEARPAESSPTCEVKEMEGEPGAAEAEAPYRRTYELPAKVPVHELSTDHEDR